MTMLSFYQALKTRRGLVLIIALILALSLLLSAAFVLVELHHACTGEHCEICIAVAHSVEYLKAQGIARLLPLMSVSFGFAIALFFCLAQRKPSCASSPVSLKVKLSD
jgi:hypothetical protein